jgi:hypothetical protein
MRPDNAQMGRIRLMAGEAREGDLWPSLAVVHRFEDVSIAVCRFVTASITV